MSRMLKDWGFAVALGLVVYFVVSWWQTRPPDVSGLAPEFTARDTSGNEVDLASLRGRPVVLNFWATWCGPCRAEMPDFARFAKDNPDVAVLGAAVQSGTSFDVATTAHRLGVEYPVFVAPDAMVAEYKIDVFPTTFIIDADGHVRSTHVGMMKRSELEAAVK